VLLSAFQGTECLGTPIHLGFARGFDEATPRTRTPVERGLLPIGSALVLDPAEKVQGLQHGRPCLGPLKRDGSESIVYVIIASVKSSEIHPLTLKRANNAIVRSTMSFAREMMIDLRLKRPNQCL
jgi:hypothetical protein